MRGPARHNSGRPGEKPVRWLAIIAAATLLATGCARGSLLGPSDGSERHSGELSFCAEEVNRYRASIGLSALSRANDLEAFAAEAARNDGLAHKAHHWFATTNGAGTAAAENEILWWTGFAVRQVIREGLKQMWDSGPKGEHYDIMVGSYSHIGCGVFVNGSEVTVVQDFR